MKELENDETFNSYYKSNLSDIFLTKVINNKLKYRDLLRELIRIIAENQNKIFENILIGIRKENISIYENKNINKVFLSYAYEDKGLSFALFQYFKSNNSFLFIDWMWNDEIKNDCPRHKDILIKELNNCNQLLLLRTPNSEYKTKGNNQIRQWCAWECGIGYSRISTEKYILPFNIHNNDNYFTQDFKLMKGINPKGKIF